MGSVKRHRKVNSDSESIQWRPMPGSPNSMRYGYLPSLDDPIDFNFRLEYREPEDFHLQRDVNDFRHVGKV